MEEPLAKRFYTFIVVPNASSRLHKIRIPVRAMYALSLIGFASFLAAVGLSLYYAHMAVKVSDFSALQAENIELKVEKENLEVSATKLNTQLTNIETISRKLSTLVEANGVGGSIIDRPTEDVLKDGPANFDLKSMKERVNELQNHMGTLQTKMELRISRARVTPNIWPLKGSVLSPFGPRRDPFGEGAEFHEGVDISGAYGAPVRATADGLVIFSAQQSDYGNLIIIDHGNQITTRFGHLSRFQVKAGGAVKKGDVVGFVGMTGRTTGPHLHYEVRLNDRPVNPRGYLPREGMPSAALRP